MESFDAGNVIYTTASREEVIDFVRSIPSAVVQGGIDGDRGVGAGFRHRLAESFYSLVAPNFDRLGRGEAAANGESWKRNTEKYLAYGKGPKSSRMGTGHAPNNILWSEPGSAYSSGEERKLPRGTGHLTGDLLKHWWQVYLQNKAFLLMAGWEHKAAKARAAQVAWEDVKRFGGRTLLQTHGKRRDQVLVDTGKLRASLQPGYVVAGIGASAEYVTANAEQIFESEPGEVVVGSKHKHAAKHHEGRGRLPERRLWPEEIPPDWWDELFTQIIVGLWRVWDTF